MPEWDAQAVEHGKNRASWYEWCSRQGWDLSDPYNHRYWDRKQFAVALRRIPRDHPDRWKYVIGKRYAPSGGDGLMATLIVLSVAVMVMSIPVSIAGGFPVFFIVFPLVLGSWAFYAYRRHRLLST